MAKVPPLRHPPHFVAVTFNTIIEGAGISVDMVFWLKENTRLSGREDQSQVLWSPFVAVSHQIISGPL